MKQFDLHLTGEAPLLMHAPRSVNPLDEGTRALKALTGKRKKTDEDIAQIMRLEWHLGLYFDTEIGPYLPGVNVEIMLRDAAKLTKQGAAITRGLVVNSDKIPVQYQGPRATEQELWDANFKDYRVVGNQKNRVMRCRPWFPNWSIDIPVILEESVLDVRDVRAITERAGLMIGLGDYRPRFGRFSLN